jgi:hypothetical protein
MGLTVAISCIREKSCSRFARHAFYWPRNSNDDGPITAKVAEYIAYRIFEAVARLMRVFYPFGDQLADLEAVVALCKSIVDLMGTHSKLRSSS